MREKTIKAKEILKQDIDLMFEISKEGHILSKKQFYDFFTYEKSYISMLKDENNKLIGYCMLDMPECENSEIIDIVYIYIYKNMRRNGYGRELLSGVINDLKKSKAKDIMLEVSNLNFPAIALYKTLNFKQIFVRKKYYNDNSDALILDFKLS